MREAAIVEIEKDIERREVALSYLEEEGDLPDVFHPAVGPFRHLSIKVRVVAEKLAGRLPRRGDGTAGNGLNRALVPNYGTIAEVADLLHFSPRSLAPYVVLLAIDTTFNAEGILGLSWSQVREHPIFGMDRWQISVPKPRAMSGSGEKGTTYHRRSFATRPTDPTTTVNLLKTIRRFSKITTGLTGDHFKDRVFLFYMIRTNSYRSFDSYSGELSADSAWTNALKSFISDNSLPDFTLRTLRVSGGEVVNEVTGGNIVAQQKALGHMSLETTCRYYRTGAIRRSGQESLSLAMAWRERFITSNGRSDTRNGALLGGGHTAATPGFICTDPFNPPAEKASPGKLCALYGACATCELAAVDPHDPRAYARLVQFAHNIREAQTRLHPQRYAKAWAPQLDRIVGYWLLKFPKWIRNQESPALPPLPDLD